MEVCAFMQVIGGSGVQLWRYAADLAALPQVGAQVRVVDSEDAIAVREVEFGLDLRRATLFLGEFDALYAGVEDSEIADDLISNGWERQA